MEEMNASLSPKKAVSLLGMIEFYIDKNIIYVYKKWLVRGYDKSTGKAVENRPSVDYLRENADFVDIKNEAEYRTRFPNLPIEITVDEEKQ